jgi:drug/metabolite transporter (DMT)-like permease
MLCLLPDALIIRLSRLRGDADNESSKLGGFGLLHWRGLGQLVTVTLVHFLLIHGASWQSFSGSLRNALPTPTLFPGGACQMLGQLFFITSIRNTTVANTLLCIAMSPAFSALYSRFFFSEVLPLRTWIAVFLAFVCLLISVLGDLISNPDESATAVIPVALPFFQGGFFSISRYYGSIRRPTADMNPSLAMAGLYNAILGLIVSLGIAGGNEKLLLPASRVDGVYVFLQSAVTVPLGYIFLTTGMTNSYISYQLIAPSVNRG